MQRKQKTLEKVIAQGLLPLFYHESTEKSLDVIRTLYKAGIRSVEYTNRGESALENFRYLRKKLSSDFSDLELGAGTIKDESEAAAFIQAGADYLVSPIVNGRVGAMAHEAGLLWIPGCMTPTEIFAAQKCDAMLIKIFPANILGPEFLSSIRELFPGQKFIPTGGVEIERENIRKWFSAGVAAVGMGSKLISKELLQKNDFEELYRQTVVALELVKENRS